MRTLKGLLGLWFPALLLTLVPLSTAWAAGTPAGTVISNYATLAYKDANGNALPQIQSNTVTTIVAQVAGVDITPATSAAYVVAGAYDVFHTDVANLGNGSDVFDLTATAVPEGWTVTLYRDPNGDHALDVAEQIPENVVTSVSLAADSSVGICVLVTAPAGAADGASTPVTVTVTSQFDTGVSDAGTYTATVQTAVLSMMKMASPTNPIPGDVVTYMIMGENGGSGTAYDVVITDVLPAGVTYVPGSMRIAYGSGVTYDAATPVTDADDSPDPGNFGVTAANTVTVNWGDSPAGQTGAIFFRATVNSGVAAGTGIANIASVVYSTTSGGPLLAPTQSSNGSITVAAGPIVTLSTTALAQTGQPGDSLVYAFSVTNSGNATDAFNFELSNTLGFTDIVWLDANNDGIPGNDGDVQLTDTDGDGLVNTGNLTPGTVAHIIVVVIVTPGTGDLSVDATTVTVSSAIDPTVTGIVTLTTTVHAPVLTIVKTVSPTGAQPPQTVLTYTVTITNTGHGSATGLQLIDTIPTNTTYVAGSITVDGSTRTDAGDGDNAAIQSSSIVADFAAIGAGGSRTVAFQVTID